ncbi:hypothetical protein IFR05_015341 [Cadophora sp. M221]|nr:hypothetical protein IFR05_015341 [Cadophora sp. M221]
MSVIVAPAVRASSDKGAHVLLSSAERRIMQLDGLYKSDSLYFVITKIDQLEDYDSYIKDHRNMDQSSVEALNRIRDIDNHISELEREFDQKLKPHNKLEKQQGQLADAYQKLAPQVDKIVDELSPLGLKRKRVEDVEDSEFPAATAKQKQKMINLRTLQARMKVNSEAISKGGNELYRIQTKIAQAKKDRLTTECRIKAACIKNRNLVHCTAIQAEYDAGRAMMGKQPSEKELRVFSVSSNVFSRLNNNNKEYGLGRGFFTKADTGIPALRDALLATTWDIRERNARSFNEDAESSLSRMKLWVCNKSPEFKMSQDQRKIVEYRIQQRVSSLETKFSKLHVETSKGLQQLIKTGIFAKLPGFSKVAGEQAKSIVTNWALMPWNTHRATNKRRGVWNSAGVHYDWNFDLADNYLRLLLTIWCETLHNKVDAMQKSYDRDVEFIINDFTEALMTSTDGIDPAINEAIRLLRENILGLRAIMKNSGADIFRDIGEASKNAHRLVQPEVLSSWEDVYEQCGSDKGKGLWARNRQAHQTHVKHPGGPGGLPMYRRCGNAIKAELQSACDEISDKFEENYQEAAHQINEDLRLMLKRHTISSGSVDASPVTDNAKSQLQQALAPVFEALETAWGIEPVPKVAEEEVSPDTEAVDAESDTESLNLDEYLS